MGRWIYSRIFWGSLLIIGGISLLLENLNLFHPAGNLVWGAACVILSILFISLFYQDKNKWWSLLPSFTFLGIGLTNFLGFFSPQLEAILSGSIFLFGLSLGFLFVYLVKNDLWWSVIPSGVFATLGIVAFLDQVSVGVDSGGMFFIGIGITFGILLILPINKTNLRWASIPAAILVLLGLIVIVSSNSTLSFLIPVVLILAGTFIVLRYFFYQREQEI